MSTEQKCCYSAQANIRKWGNSQGIRLPKELLSQMDLQENDSVEITVCDRVMIIKKAGGPKYPSLKERLEAFYQKPIDEIFVGSVQETDMPVQKETKKAVPPETTDDKPFAVIEQEPKCVPNRDEMAVSGEAEPAAYAPEEGEKSAGGRERFLIIDGSSMLATAYHAFLPNEIKFAKEEAEKEKYYDKILHAPDGTYTNAVYGMLLQLKRLIDGWKPDYLAVCFDKSRQTFRRELYPEYKAQRKPTQKPLKEQFLLMERLLASAGIPVFMSNKYEADDLAGSLAMKYREHYQIRLLSKDYDYMQLVSDEYDVRLWAPAQGKEKADENAESEWPEYLKYMTEYTEESVLEQKGVLPKQIPDLKAIEGDSSDNIPGVKGVSSAAVPLLAEYGSLEEIYDNIDDCGGDTKREKMMVAFWKDSLGIKRSPLNAMKANRDIAVLSKNLATIRTDCFENYPFDLENYPLKNADFSALNKKISGLGIRTVRF